MYGVGFDVAAKLLIAVGDNPDRIRSEAAWAHLCGVAPVPASSGKVQRHRLNRGGNRQANSALYRIMLTRMSSDPRTETDVAKRTADGKTMGEIGRILNALHRQRDLPPPAVHDRLITARTVGIWLARTGSHLTW